MDNPKLSVYGEQQAHADQVSRGNTRLDHARTSSGCTATVVALVQAG